MALADLLEWVIRRRGIDHYLDDFIMLGPAHSERCRRSLDVVQELCECLRVPLAMEKLKDPTTCLTFLGIEVYTEAMELRLLETKLKSLTAAVKEWYGHKSCTKHELLSFIGMLSHACIVVCPGRRFLRRLINLSKPMHPSQRRVSIGHRVVVHIPPAMEWRVDAMG